MRRKNEKGENAMRKETRGRKPKDPKVAISHGQLIALRFTQQDYPAIGNGGRRSACAPLGKADFA